MFLRLARASSGGNAHSKSFSHKNVHTVLYICQIQRAMPWRAAPDYGVMVHSNHHFRDSHSDNYSMMCLLREEKWAYTMHHHAAIGSQAPWRGTLCWTVCMDIFVKNTCCVNFGKITYAPSLFLPRVNKFGTTCRAKLVLPIYCIVGGLQSL